MNKQRFVQTLQERTGLDPEQCSNVNMILEEHFLIGKNNRDRIVQEVKVQLSITEERARQIVDIAFEILHEALRSRLKHPFGDQAKF